MDHNQFKNPINPTDAPNNQPLHQAYMQNHLVKQIQKKSPGRYLSTKGSGAYGKFTVTQDLKKYTSAKLFSEIGKETKIFARFSTMLAEKGSADTERDIRGFSLKFYTEEGNWDLVGSSSPVFYVKEPSNFAAFIQSHSRDPRTNLKSETARWNFYSTHPESLHQLLINSSERGIPFGYRHMNGYGTHTYAFINAAGERFWVKFHFKPMQGTKNFTGAEVDKTDFAQQDLVHAVDTANYPKWAMFIQIMTMEEANEYRWNPFDVTKVWLQDDFPLIEVGELELNRIPEDYFSHVEQATFSPGTIVPGIGFSPDKMLQTRIFAYTDAHQNRTGLHAEQLQVNRNPYIQPSYFASEISHATLTTFTSYDHEDDHYTQPGLFYTKALTDETRAILVENIIKSMKQVSGPEKHSIINRQLCHFFRANIELGMKIAMGLQVNIDANMMSHTMNQL